jgi:PKD repeat protein
VGNQNLKMVRLEKVVNLDGGEEPPPPPPPPATSLSFVGQATRNVNSTAFTVQVPANVQAQDALLLFASAGSDRVLSGPGAGWTQIGRVVDGTHATTVWRRIAAPGDAGSTVRITSGGVFTKVGMTLAAYRGADPTDPVASITGAGEPGTTASHRTPTSPNSTEGAWRVSYWSDKSSATTAWTPPAGETVRATTAGAGGGRVGTLLTDPAAGLTAGTPAITGGLLATANSSTSAATMWTILLRPASTGPPANQAPTASFTHQCAERTCTFDGGGSTDPEDNVVSWTWEFGDEADGAPAPEPGPEAVVEHTYAADGIYTVKLTVADDDGATDEVEQTITVGDPPPPPTPPVSFVGQATRNVNSTAFNVPVPSAVQAGDALLLFVSQGNTTALTGPGAGWTQIGRVVDGEVTTVWRKVATAGDAGSTVSLSSGATYVKVAMTLAAYRGTDTTDPVASITGAPEPGSSTAHTTPTTANTTDGALRVSYWSDKNSATTAWTPPAGETTRAVTIGAGGGRVSGLLTDSGEQLTAGTPASTGGLVATTDAASSTATMWTLLLRPGA